MSNLLSGFLGALVGGLFSLVATYMTFRHDRSQVRLSASRTACSAILQDILIIDTAMVDVQSAMEQGHDWSDPNLRSSFETVRAAAQRILYVYNVLIAKEALNSQISEFIQKVNEWHKNALNSTIVVNQERIDAIESNIPHLNVSINAHIRGQRSSHGKLAPSVA